MEKELTDYPDTVDLPSYIPGYESYCEQIEKNNQKNYTSEFTEEDDRKIDEFRLQEFIRLEELNGKSNL